MQKKWKKNRIWISCAAAVVLLIGIAAIIMTQMVNKEITVTINGETQDYTTTEVTVADFLDQQNIQLGELDKITPEQSQWLSDGTKINIVKAVSFTVQADGETRELQALPYTVQDALETNDIVVDGDDKVVPALSQPLTEGTEIVIKRIETKMKEVMESIDYETETRGDDSLSAGTSEVIQKGEKGKEKVTYKVVYSDGKVIKKTEVSRERVREPKNKIVAESTRGMIAGSEYKKKFTVKAYAYSGGGRTAMGTSARVGEIAVDPGVIPLGTRVYVEGYGFARAEDTGGNIKGETIDVYLNSESAASRWGVRYVTIYILA